MENKYDENMDALLQKAFLAQNLASSKNETLIRAITNATISEGILPFRLSKPNIFKASVIFVIGVFGVYLFYSTPTIESTYTPTIIKFESTDLRNREVYKTIPMAEFAALTGQLQKPSPKGKSLPVIDIKEQEEIKVYTPNYVEEIIPTLTEEQIRSNNKLKESLLKDLLKINKKKFSTIAVTSQNVIEGENRLVNFVSWKTEVSNLEYRIFLNDLIINERFEDYSIAKINKKGWTEWHSLSYLEPMDDMYHWHPAYNEYPVVNIPRSGAELFCEWLTAELKKSDKNKNGLVSVRIPTNREWEYLASSGFSNSTYPWGGPYVRNDNGCFLANFKPGSNYTSTCMQGREKTMDDAVLDSSIKLGPYVADGGLLTVKVDSYNPNQFGIYNAAGNVSEMVTYPYEGNKIGARGGNWNSTEDEIKIYAKDPFVGVNQGSPLIGFRPVIVFK